MQEENQARIEAVHRLGKALQKEEGWYYDIRIQDISQGEADQWV
jgi:hypothetical protein